MAIPDVYEWVADHWRSRGLHSATAAILLVLIINISNIFMLMAIPGYAGWTCRHCNARLEYSRFFGDTLIAFDEPYTSPVHSWESHLKPWMAWAWLQWAALPDPDKEYAGAYYFVNSDHPFSPDGAMSAFLMEPRRLSEEQALVTLKQELGEDVKQAGWLSLLERSLRIVSMAPAAQQKVALWRLSQLCRARFSSTEDVHVWVRRVRQEGIERATTQV